MIETNKIRNEPKNIKEERKIYIFPNKLKVCPAKYRFIREIKEFMFDEEALQPSQQEYYFRGIKLEDDDDVNNLEFDENNSLFCILRPIEPLFVIFLAISQSNELESNTTKIYPMTIHKSMTYRKFRQEVSKFVNYPPDLIPLICNGHELPKGDRFLSQDGIKHGDIIHVCNLSN